MMKTCILAAALAITGCATEDLGTAGSALGLKPGGSSGNHFYWAAYQQQPYIYMGCPEPGPQPWAERATLYAHPPDPDIDRLELELGTAVPLEIRALSVPRGVRLLPHSRGVSIEVGDPFVGDPVGFSMLVTHGRCSYELEAEIVYE